MTEIVRYLEGIGPQCVGRSKSEPTLQKQKQNKTLISQTTQQKYLLIRVRRSPS